MSGTRSKTGPIVKNPRQIGLYVVETCAEGSLGVFTSFELAVDAIRATIALTPSDKWSDFAIVLHCSNTTTIGCPDAIRWFHDDGVPYTPQFKRSGETVPY
jgi:hypothetical protein